MNTILLIGAGNMGFSMLERWLQELDNTYQMVVVDPTIERRLSDLGIVENDRITAVLDLDDLHRDIRPSAIVFATKPDTVCEAVRRVQHTLQSDTVLISVAAGLEIDEIRACSTGKNPIVRVMPNIGALVGQSASAGFATLNTTLVQSTLVETLFHALGEFIWLGSEYDMHTVTAVSGSGPAYFFAMCEAMIEAAVEYGLNRDVAARLVHTTCAGAGRLIEQTPDAALLRQQVTSPNGTTAAGLDALAKEHRLQTIVAAAVAAARQRSLEMT